MSVAPGDRIKVIALMTDDPLPPPLGATGTVVEVDPAIVNSDDGVNYKARIIWDEGTAPAVGTLLIPQDEHVFEVIPWDMPNHSAEYHEEVERLTGASCPECRPWEVAE